MQFAFLFQSGQNFGLLGSHQEGNGRGKLLFILNSLAGVGIVTGGSGNGDNLYILQLRRDHGFAHTLVVGHKDGDDVAALQLAGKASGKALDGDRDGLFGAVQIVQIGILGCGLIRELAVQNVVAHLQVGSGVLANDVILVCHNAGRQVIGAHLHGLHHLSSDLVALLDVGGDADDLSLLAGAAAEQGRYSKADEERQKDTQHTDHGAVTENFHTSLLIRNMRG